jgi:hypothetical protein
MDHLSLSSHPQGKIKTRVKFASAALAARLATGPLHGDQAATEERLLVKDLGQAGPSPPFWIWQVASGAHRDYLLLSDINIYIRLKEACQALS